MGSWLNRLWWGGDPEEVNAVTGMTRRDAHVVQKLWARVYLDPTTIGVTVFKQLFRSYPETKEFFGIIYNVPEEDLAKHPQFKAHVSNFMSMLNLGITNLQEPEVVAALMSRLGESHKKRQIQDQHFHCLKKVTVEILTENFKVDQYGISCWEKIVDFMYKHIFESLNS